MVSTDGPNFMNKIDGMVSQHVNTKTKPNIPMSCGNVRVFFLRNSKALNLSFMYFNSLAHG
jgi:hypothetical protein